MTVLDFWTVPDGFPRFDGIAYADHIAAWHTAQAAIQDKKWLLAAIAASIERSVGGRGRKAQKRYETTIQRFIKDVDIDRQTFQRLTRTYKVFFATRTTGGTSFLHLLSFKHHEVAARLVGFPDATVVLAEAHNKKWKANELERQLMARKGAPPFSLSDAMAKLRAAIVDQLSAWPASARDDPNARRRVVELSQQVFDDLDARTLPPLTPAEVHALRWIRADLENLPFVKRTFNETWRRGGDLEVVGGAAGAPIYQVIVGDVSGASRARVLNAIDNLLAGTLTPLGQLVFDVARDLADGKPSVVRQMTLPPDAGGDLTGTRWEAADDDDLPDFLHELVADFSDPIGLRDVEVAL